MNIILVFSTFIQMSVFMYVWYSRLRLGVDGF